MFYDLVMVGLGVCDVRDIAISVLASVIGHQKKKGWVITDAGWMALSCDRGSATQKINQGYGLVCDIEGEAQNYMIVSSASQEHGIITHREGEEIDWEQFGIGRAVRILPNHSCAIAAMHDRYHVIAGDMEVAEILHHINGS